MLGRFGSTWSLCRDEGSLGPALTRLQDTGMAGTGRINGVLGRISDATLSRKAEFLIMSFSLSDLKKNVSIIIKINYTPQKKLSSSSISGSLTL